MTLRILDETTPAPELRDRRGRRLADLRISVTDRCNFRCTYCMPRELFGADHPFLARPLILTFEEIDRAAGLFVPLGVRKIRLTGGEPLLRRDLPELVRRLGRHGVELTLTTNGSLLAEQAGALRSAGLDRITVSLDSLDPAVFRRINDALGSGRGPRRDRRRPRRRLPAAQGQHGSAARRQRGEHPAARRALPRHRRHRALHRVHGRGTHQRLEARRGRDGRRDPRGDRPAPRRRIARSSSPGEVARRHRFVDGSGEIGIIASVTRPFCGDCNRLRLSADGGLFTCLFGDRALDLRAPLRDGTSDEEIARRIRALWSDRQDRYSEIRSAATASLPRAGCRILAAEPRAVTANASDRRKSRRIPVPRRDGALEISLDGTVLDISLSGMAIETASRLAPRANITLHLHHADGEVSISGHVVWCFLQEPRAGQTATAARSIAPASSSRRSSGRRRRASPTFSRRTPSSRPRRDCSAASGFRRRAASTSLPNPASTSSS
ncbi:MAG: radical SAM protein [Thermoanaerobaculia bacterium]